MLVAWIPRHQIAVAARSTVETVNKVSSTFPTGPGSSPVMIGKQTRLDMELRRAA